MKNDKLNDLQGLDPIYKKGGNTMKTKMKKLMKNQKGMTLIELLAVIVIIAIIAAIAIPAVGNIITNQKEKKILADTSTILSGAKLALADGACGDDGCSNSELSDFVDGVTGTYSASKAGSTWSVTYDQLKTITKDRFKKINNADVISSTDDVITESELITLMGK